MIKNHLDQIPFKVESLLPLTIKRESTDQAKMYTACTCPRKVVMNAPSDARHNLTDLSNDAEAMNLMGENQHSNKRFKYLNIIISLLDIW